MAQNAHLLLTKTKIMPTIPSPRGVFGGPKQSTKPPQTKSWNTYTPVEFFLSIFQCQAPPIEDFPATVLHVECRTENQ